MMMSGELYVGTFELVRVMPLYPMWLCDIPNQKMLKICRVQREDGKKMKDLTKIFLLFAGFHHLVTILRPRTKTTAFHRHQDWI